MANGDLAFTAGLPVADPDEDIRLGPDQINALADALARIITQAWKQGVNTNENLATTADIFANGKVTANILRAEGQLSARDAFIDATLNVASTIITANITANGEVTVRGKALRGALDALEGRVAALEAK